MKWISEEWRRLAIVRILAFVCIFILAAAGRLWRVFAHHELSNGEEEDGELPRKRNLRCGSQGVGFTLKDLSRRVNKIEEWALTHEERNRHAITNTGLPGRAPAEDDDSPLNAGGLSLRNFLGKYLGSILGGGAVVAVAVWGNLILEAQRETLQEQAKHLAESVAQQAESAAQQENMRDESAIFDCRTPLAGDLPSSRPCEAGAHPRIRRKAIIRYLKSARAKGIDVDLGQVNLESVDLYQIDLQGVVLDGSDFSRISQPRFDVTGSFLRASWFENADLEEASFRDTELNGVHFNGATIVKSDFEGACLLGAEMYSTNLSDSRLFCADLRDTLMREAILRNADLIGAQLAGACLAGADLRDADLRESTLDYANLSGANLKDADLRSASSDNADFSYAELGGANLGSAALTSTSFFRAVFGDANLTLANLKGAILYEADLSAVETLSQPQIQETCGDSSTRLPESIQPPEQWGDDEICSRKLLLRREESEDEEEYDSKICSRPQKDFTREPCLEEYIQSCLATIQTNRN